MHATIVCAARSCPPLQRRAFTAENLAALTAEAFTAWLRREDLNRYLPERNRVEVSKIFDWFEEDFTGEGSLRNLLLRFGPPEHEAFFREGDFRVRYRDYDWGLNDQGSLGENYSPGLFGIL